MVRTYFLTSVIILLSFLSFAQKPYEDYKIDSTLHGNVKSITEKLEFIDKNYRIVKLGDKTPRFVTSSYTFGNEDFARIKFDANWHHSAKVTYLNNYKKFNLKGLLTYKTWTDKFKNVISTYKYEYDHDTDKLLKVTETFNDGTSSITNYAYNQNNDLLTSLTVHRKIDIDDYYYYNIYIYNVDSKLVMRNFFGDKGKREGDNKYVYDSKKRLKLRIDMDHKDDSKAIEKLYYENFYDEDDNIIEVHYFNSKLDENGKQPIRAKEIKTYHQKRLLKTQWQTIDKTQTTVYNFIGKIESKTINYSNQKKKPTTYQYYYGRHNYITKLIYTENDVTKIITFKYKFDKHNNWTKQIKSVNGKELFILTREIKYFKS